MSINALQVTVFLEKFVFECSLIDRFNETCI